MELLQFIFQNGWHFFGFVTIELITIFGIAFIIEELRKPRT